MPPVKANFDIAAIFGKPIEHIDAIIANKESNVHKIQIPKRDGSKRTILAPTKDLKFLQKAIYWKLLMRYKPSEASHGFVRSRSIKKRAIWLFFL
jgi:retron-type reverse transcriptase